MYPLPKTDPTIPVDAIVERIIETYGYYFRTITVKKAGTVIPQHVHDHHHATLIGHGSARVWRDGAWVGDFKMGEVLLIPAHSQHMFQVLEPDTVLTCVHNVESASSLYQKGL